MIKILNKKGDLLKNVDSDYLCGSDLRGSDLRCANLSGYDLSRAKLRRANLRWADLRYADLSCADLRGADLSWANLSGVNMFEADLRDTNLSGTKLIIIKWEFWTTYITEGNIRIGCRSHTINEWKEFSDDEINKMDSITLDFWKQNKKLIIELCERFGDGV